MNLSVIIVSYNVKEKLRQNLQALASSVGDLAFEVIVVDNNSSDGSAAMVANDFSEVKLIANQDNLGFAKANNQALKIAQGDYLLLLNPDMRVFPETLYNFWRFASNNQQATVCGGRLVDVLGENIDQVRRFPKLSDQLAIVLKLPHFCPKIINRYLNKNFDYSRPQAVDSVRGSFFLINRQSWKKISGFDPPLLDERYFIWFEEVDFCRQVISLGGEVWYTPAAKAIDYVGQSFSQVGTGRKQKYFRRSMLQYFAKWQGPVSTGILWLAWLPSLLIFHLWKRK